MNNTVDNEMLTNATNGWSECLQQLPIDSIVKHVQQNNRLISDANVWVTLELNQKFFYPIKAFLVIGNLGYKK